MEKRMLWLGVVLMVVGLCSSGALAATLGPPAAGLDAGQFRVGVDISSSQTGIDIDGEGTAQLEYAVYNSSHQLIGSGVEIGDPERFKFKDDALNEMVFANLGYGIVDKLEVYLLLGVSDLGFETQTFVDEGDARGMDQEFGSSDELAYGFGVKGTIFEDGDVNFGALFQMTWASFDGDMSWDDVDVERDSVPGFPGFDETVDDVPGTWDLDYYQMKFAVGPTYKLTETISIYGGPFYQLMNGNLDIERSRPFDTTDNGNTIIGVVSEEESVDISERSRYGIYFGAQINCGGNLPIRVECQTSNETYVVGASLAYAF